MAAGSSGSHTREVNPARWGKIDVMGFPADFSDVIAVTTTLEWFRRIRMSSPPVYPLDPTIAMFSFSSLIVVYPAHVLHRSIAQNKREGISTFPFSNRI